MCAVSMIGDHYQQKWNHSGTVAITSIPDYASRNEFEQLKREVQEMKQLLLRAKKYDERTGQPHCEQEQKVALLKQMAKAVDISLEEIFPSDKKETT